MSFHVSISAVAMLLALGGAASAGTYASGPAYGGAAVAGGSVNCRVFNSSATPVSLPVRQIFDNTGAAVSIVSDGCNGSLTAGKSCAFSGNIAGNLAFSCRVVTYGQDGYISGTTEILKSGTVLLSLPLQKN